VKRAILVVLVVIFGAISAEIYIPDQPVASPDGHLAARINPAALAFGNASGLTFEGYFNEDFETFSDEYSIYLITGGLSYILDHNVNDHHTLLLSTKYKNISYGFGYNWENKFYRKGEMLNSILFRPSDYFSLGASGTDIFDTDDAQYILGAAIRPFAFKGNLGSRITLTTDFHYSDENWEDPVIGIQTELVDGLFFGGNYKMETETIGLNFSLRFGQIGIGNSTKLDQDNKVSGGNWFINFSDNYYRSIFESKKPNQFYDLKLQGKIKEKKTGFQIGPFSFIDQKEKTLSEIITLIEKLKKEDRIQGILFKSANFNLSFAGMQELHEALIDFKSTGKKIVYYSENISNKGYIFAASVADEIYLHPSGWLELKGLSVSVPYVSELLDTLGIEVVNFQSHKYKTAGNMFSETEMTESERESYEYLLDGLFAEEVQMINSGRGDKLKKSIEVLIDEGPYLVPENALNSGLIDGIIFEDELEGKLEALVTDAEIVKNIRENKIRYDWSEDKKDKIAIIYCVGSIHMGKGKTGRSIGSITTARAIKNAREDKSIKGIILRIDSGGGSALASDVITREVELCRSGDNMKPIIVSMAGVAASGGYFMASMCDMIIAQPTTITGSIGVIGMLFNFEDLYEKIHINWSTVKRGKFSDLGNSSRKMTEEEKDKIRESISYTYEQFISYVARGRKMDVESVHEIAQGRVWTGKQALDRGLVDKLGGMKLAMEEISLLAQLNHEIELVEFEGNKTTVMNVGHDTVEKIMVKDIPVQLKSFYEVYSDWKLYGNEKILKVIPYNLEIQ